MNPLSFFDLYSSIKICMMLFLTSILLLNLIRFLKNIDRSLSFIVSMMKLPYHNGGRYLLLGFVQLLMAFIIILIILVLFCLYCFLFCLLFQAVYWGLYQTVPNFFAFSLVQFTHSIDLLYQLFVFFKILLVKFYFFFFFVIVWWVFKHCEF